MRISVHGRAIPAFLWSGANSEIAVNYHLDY